ncbi:MAG: hypothetical protein AABX72_02005 [Nanoarchaeota archaeon]
MLKVQSSKRGQIYLVSALILVFILYMILTPTNIIKKSTESSNFEQIAKNFDRESAHFMNELIKTDQPVQRAMLNFTFLFSSYAKTKNPDFGLIYTFMYKDKLYLANYAHDRVIFSTEDASLASINGCLAHVQTSFSTSGLSMNIPNVNIGTYQNCLKELPVPASFDNEIVMTIHELDTGMNTTFTSEITPYNPDLIIISKEKKGNIRRIYTKGKFI